MLETVISRPIYRVLTDLTQQPRVEVSLPIAIKELVTLKLIEANERCHTFEQRYGMEFEAFRDAWNEDRIPDRYGYQVEQDYWDWEAAVTDRQKLAEMMDTLA